MVFQRGEYRFEIDAFTPETLPMARLAEYMAEFALMLGQPEHVHFVRLQKGSTAVVANVEWEAIPKVRERIRAVRSQNPDAPLEAVRAFHRIDNRLAEDNATGALVEPTGKTVIRFAGRKRKIELEYGAVRQPGTVDGVPIVIGGEKDPVPVHLEDRDRIHNCYAKRTVARQIAAFIFTTPVRASGLGVWRREESGLWVMERFLIQDFKPLDDASLSDVVDDLRRIDGSWQTLEDPLDELNHIRHGNRGRQKAD